MNWIKAHIITQWWGSSTLPSGRPKVERHKEDPYVSEFPKNASMQCCGVHNHN